MEEQHIEEFDSASDSDTLSENEEIDDRLRRQVDAEVHIYQKAVDGTIQHKRKYVPVSRALKPINSSVDKYEVCVVLLMKCCTSVNKLPTHARKHTL